MIAAIIAGLLAMVLCLAKLWSGYKAENAELKIQVASLRRQLTKHRRTG